jgi:hypothetical protein
MHYVTYMAKMSNVLKENLPMMKLYRSIYTYLHHVWAVLLYLFLSCRVICLSYVAGWLLRPQRSYLRCLCFQPLDRWHLTCPVTGFPFPILSDCPWLYRPITNMLIFVLSHTAIFTKIVLSHTAIFTKITALNRNTPVDWSICSQLSPLLTKEPLVSELTIPHASPLYHTGNNIFMKSNWVILLKSYPLDRFFWKAILSMLKDPLYTARGRVFRLGCNFFFD